MVTEMGRRLGQHPPRNRAGLYKGPGEGGKATVHMAGTECRDRCAEGSDRVMDRQACDGTAGGWGSQMEDAVLNTDPGLGLGPHEWVVTPHWLPLAE